LGLVLFETGEGEGVTEVVFLRLQLAEAAGSRERKGGRAGGKDGWTDEGEERERGRKGGFERPRGSKEGREGGRAVEGEGGRAVTYLSTSAWAISLSS